MKVGSALSILINELVMNAAKHGEGIIELTLTVEAEQGKLIVCDEGPGFPPGFDPRQAAHTGLELVGGVSHLDLGGEVLFQNRAQGGACVTVTFSISSR